jgi:hypothetical protein
MAFSIPLSLQAIMTGIVQSVWENTPGLITSVIIHKEPLQTIISNPQNLFPGYGDSTTSNQEISYTPVNRTFSGQVIYPQKERGSRNIYLDDKIQLDPNKTYLRAKEDVNNYLRDGRKTEKIEVDGKVWNYDGMRQEQNFLNLKFFYFEITATN